MVIEHANLTIKEGLVEEFVQTIQSAFSLLSSSKGYISHKLLQNKEYPNQFILVVKWNKLEDHLEGFVGSHEFEKWNLLIDRFFEHEPLVLHYSEIKYK